MMPISLSLLSFPSTIGHVVVHLNPTTHNQIQKHHRPRRTQQNRQQDAPTADLPASVRSTPSINQQDRRPDHHDRVRGSASEGAEDSLDGAVRVRDTVVHRLLGEDGTGGREPDTHLD